MSVRKMTILLRNPINDHVFEQPVVDVLSVAMIESRDAIRRGYEAAIVDWGWATFDLPKRKDKKR